MSLPPMVRFWRFVDVAPSGCWTWGGAKRSGYGLFFFVGRCVVLAHRFSYRMLVGPIPDGLQIDHLCRNRACVNPAHLEPVTPTVNARRSPSANGAKTHCKYGHAFTVDNTIHYGVPLRRVCRACQSSRRQYRQPTVLERAS